MKYRTTYVLALLIFNFLLIGELNAQGRHEISFNDNWRFQGQSISGISVDELITLPHTWNSQDAQEGIQYYRGVGNYTKLFDAEDSWKNKRVFIRFDGANIIAKVTLNGQELGVHKGGYAAFIFEITDHLVINEQNRIQVEVSNEANLEVIPLVGDFNNYGGIYRPVNLIITEPICITPLDFASPGVYIKQQNVSEKSADIEVLTKISNGTNAGSEVAYQTTILDAKGEIVKSFQSLENVGIGEHELLHSYSLDNPHLWNGRKDPYVYRVKVDILVDGKLVDSKTEPLGLRYFHIDADEGFFLNGQPIDLRGVSRHQDRKDKGSAISLSDHKEDMEIMLDMGINALRLAHYQHAELIYEIADSAGLIVWAELPWVGMPAGFMSSTNGYEKTEAFHTIAKQQLYELIRQNYNHPSIHMWCIFNEIQNPEGMEPIDFIAELNDVVKAEDPDRLTVGASMLSPQKNPDMHKITDGIAWNRYFGWYYKEPKDMGVFLDEVHKDFPELKIGISEYGAGGSIEQHSSKLSPPNPMGSPHPEEWQSFYHEENLKIFDERPYVWGTFVWNMFDFGSHFRKEGDHYGINDKGLVTYDRKTRKDAFYFYKANWSEDPVLHITSSRFIFREEAESQVKVYTNLEDISLTVNGKEFETKSPEKGIIIWDGVVLQDGNNGIIVTATKNGKTYSDDCVWVLVKPYQGMNLFLKIFDFMMIAYKVVLGGFIAAFLVWLLGIRKVRKGPKWKKIVYKTLFVLLILSSLLILVAKYLISNMMGG